MSPEQSEEILRLRALTAFLGAGMATAPTPDLMVRWLGEARRSVTIIQARGEPLDEWLASETRLRGIRENAAVLAAMEVPSMRDRVASEYAHQHPDRVETLQQLLKYL